jgi:photosystem II stability/assembly factor-like uncharacterized protein
VRTLILIFILFVGIFVLAYGDAASWWQIQKSGTDANLRGVNVRRTGKDNYVAWVSGTRGAIRRSLDRGKSWKEIRVDGADDLDFRDIEAFGEDTAYLMSSGDGEKSRIYKTSDGGKSWRLQYSDKRAGFFLDSLACGSKDHCFALSDPVDGKFLVLVTGDGEHWSELPGGRMPVALATESAFAASGTSIVLCDSNILFGTGGPAARVFRSADRGRSWTAVETPLAHGNSSSGIFSIACSGRSVVAVGGDYKDPSGAGRVAIYSTDLGESWHLAAGQTGGYRSGAAFFSGTEVVAVGTNGSDVSHDGGVHWTHLGSSLNLNAVSFSAGDGWAVGPKGAIARFVHRTSIDTSSPSRLPTAR